jgi:hypothetical protein
MFDELIKNPLVKKALAAGEERVGKVVTAVLSNERVMSGVQSAVSSALGARSVLEKGVRSALSAVNLPTTEDVAELKQRLAELESIIDGLAARLERQDGEGRARGPEADRDDQGRP